MWIIFLVAAIVIGVYMLWYIMNGETDDSWRVGFRHADQLNVVPVDFLVLLEEDFALQKDIEGAMYMLLNQYQDRSFCRNKKLKQRRKMIKWIKRAYRYLKESRFRDFETAFYILGDGTSEQATAIYGKIIAEMLRQRYLLPQK